MWSVCIMKYIGIYRLQKNVTWLFSAVVAVNKMVVVSKEVGKSLSPGKLYSTLPQMLALSTPILATFVHPELHCCNFIYYYGLWNSQINRLQLIRKAPGHTNAHVHVHAHRFANSIPGMDFCLLIQSSTYWLYGTLSTGSISALALRLLLLHFQTRHAIISKNN